LLLGRLLDNVEIDVLRSFLEPVFGTPERGG
jgi:hypothetical protein